MIDVYTPADLREFRRASGRDLRHLKGSPFEGKRIAGGLAILDVDELLRAHSRRQIAIVDDIVVPTVGGGANVKTALGTEAQTITCTLASLASGSSREATAIDNTTNLWLEALVMVQITLQSGTPASDRAVYVYAAATVDNAGPTWPDAVTGADAAITLNSPTNLRLLGAINAPTSAGVFKGGPWSVSSIFGGVLPSHWSIVINNATGIALTATEGNHKKLYQGVYATST
jgi:hypothetical protein